MNKTRVFWGMILMMTGIIYKYWDFISTKDDFLDTDYRCHFRQEIIKRNKKKDFIGFFLIIISIFLFILGIYYELAGESAIDKLYDILKKRRINWSDVWTNILLSLIASYCFWFLTFRISLTNIIFAKYLAKAYKPADANEPYSYRIRFANIGYRDLIELTILAKLVIKENTHNRVFFMNVTRHEKEGLVVVLPSIVTYKIKKRSNLRTMTLHISESMKEGLSDVLGENFQLDDLFAKYGNNITITVYIFGNDRITGARKLFESPNYTIKDIKEGDFCGSKEIKIPLFSNVKTKTDKISQIHKNIYL